MALCLFSGQEPAGSLLPGQALGNDYLSAGEAIVGVDADHFTPVFSPGLAVGVDLVRQGLALVSGFKLLPAAGQPGQDCGRFGPGQVLDFVAEGGAAQGSGGRVGAGCSQLRPAGRDSGALRIDHLHD